VCTLFKYIPGKEGGLDETQYILRYRLSILSEYGQVPCPLQSPLPVSKIKTRPMETRAAQHPGGSGSLTVRLTTVNWRSRILMN